MKEYDAYLFDWDGTLANTLNVWVTVIRNTFAGIGIPLSNQEVAPLIGGWNLILERVPPAKHAAFKRTIEDTAYPQLEKPPLYDDAKAMLKDLKMRNKKLALITSSKREAIDIVLARHELVDRFDLIITADEVQAHKPNPEGILSALKHLGITKDRAVMLGDSDKDLGAARNAGIDSILFYPEEHAQIHQLAHLQSFGPVKTIASWQELIQLMGVAANNSEQASPAV